ncbi:Asp-tRNA(Asn)/Glu-tRNA(Gln) amidotransferase subunit GatC [Phycisphaeraceae bacterium D3-23]
MPQPAISEDDVRHAAKLSRLALTDGQVHQYTDQLANILGYIQKLNELDIAGIEPMPHALDQHNVLRDDNETPGLDPDDALANAPDREGPFFKVPKVLGDGGGA